MDGMITHAEMFDPRDPPHPAVDVEAIFDPPSAEDWQVLDAQEALSRLIQTYGAARIQVWLKNMAALNGESL